MTARHPAVLDLFSDGDTAARPAVAKVEAGLFEARRELAGQWMAMPDSEAERHYAERLGQLHRMICSAELRNGPRSDADRAFNAQLRAALAREPRQATAGQLLAAFLFLFPHELPQRYDVEAIPPWLRPDYVAYLLSGPLMFREIGEADRYFDYAERFVASLHDGVTAKINDELWRNIALFFTQKAGFLSVYFNNRNARELYRRRAAIMEAAMRGLNSPLDHKFGRRASRSRLRVGVLAAHYLPQTETYATLPFYQYLDRTKFEVTLFALMQGNHPLEKFCARQADRFVALPADLRQRLQILRDADLDFVFIGTNTTAFTSDVALLALHRLARIQITSICSCVTTGMRNMDYYLSGRLTEPADAQAHYTEKLVMLDGPAHCFSLPDEPAGTPPEAISRSALGLSADATVFVSGANFYKILPEVEDAWLRVLSSVPGSYLLLYPFNLNWSNVYPATAFGQRLGVALARHGLDHGRVIVLRAAPHRSDVLQRLRLADVYLDSFPYSGATSLLDPLQVGLPVVAMDGGPARAQQAASFLRAIEAEELVARDVDAYVALAVRLATDAEFNTRMRERIAQKMKAVPKFLDGKWYGTQVGLALERMWKESAYAAG